jgi:hypothetical protein
MPVVITSPSSGSASSTARGNLVRSRMSTTTSKPARATGSCSWVIGSAKNSTVTSSPSEAQSAHCAARRW